MHSEEQPSRDETTGLEALGLSSSEVPPPPRATRRPSPGDAAGRPEPRRRSLGSRLSTSDLVFRNILRGGGVFVLLLELFVGTFLFYRANLALKKAGWSFITTQHWSPNGGSFGIAAVMVGTILIALVAVLIAIPLSLGMALFISEYAPLPVKRLLASLVDLMAAVPSVVFGLWGAFLLQWRMVPLAKWISAWFYWIPIFNVPGVDRHDPTVPATSYTSSTFMAGAVVSLMITPIACSIMREAFSQAPIGEREGALALGATRWGMIRSVVLPFGQGAMIGGIMLGLGRALGETIAVAMIISPDFVIQPHVLAKGASSISSLIALDYQETTQFGISALMAAGLSLFVLTLFVNIIAAQIVARSRSGAVSDA